MNQDVPTSIGPSPLLSIYREWRKQRERRQIEDTKKRFPHSFDQAVRNWGPMSEEEPPLHA